MFMFALLVVAGVGLYVMTPEERARLVAHVAEPLRKVLDVARGLKVRGHDPFSTELRTRVRWPIVTYVLAAINVAVLVMGLAEAGALNDPAALVAWGGNFGPRTTDGERWRILTSIFVHRDILHLLVNVAALVQLGLVLERVAGPFTFGTVFLAAGALGSIMSGAASPMSVFVGATSAVFGLYGLLLATMLRGLLQRTAIRIPVAVLIRMTPVAGVFALYHLVTGEAPLTAQAGLCTGVISGIVLTRSVGDHAVRLRRFAALGAATASIVLLAAMSVRAVTDIRPEVARIVESEQQTSEAYDAAVVRFRSGRTTARDLAEVIDGTILPTLESASERMSALVNVPRADAALVADTQAYLQLRGESWRARAQALRKGSMPGLRDADKVERSSLELFERVRSAAADQPPAQSR